MPASILRLPPGLTLPQLTVLAALGTGERPGPQVRAGLSKYGVTRSGPAFYMLMDRLETAGLVVSRLGRRRPAEGVGGAPVFYKLTKAGAAARDAALAVLLALACELPEGNR